MHTSSSYSIYADPQLIEESHQSLLETLSRLIKAPDHEFILGFPALIATLEQDFRCEEDQMEQADPDLYHVNTEQHARMLSALHHVAPRVQEGNLELGREAVDLLAEWMPYHVATADAVLARQVAARLNPPGYSL